MIKWLLILFIVLELVSCKENSKPGLEMVLSTPQLKISNTLETAFDYNHFQVVHYSIKNNSNSPYVIIPYMKSGEHKNDIGQNRLISGNGKIEFGNLVISANGERQDIVSHRRPFVCLFPATPDVDNLELYYQKKEQKREAKNKFYKRLYPKFERDRAELNTYLGSSYRIIPANSEIHFTGYVSLPYSRYCEDCEEYDYFQTDSLKDYKVALYFKIDTTDLSSFIPANVIKTIKENNFKIFHGELKSNEIPVFIDRK